jgi:hypothetical protein
MGLAGKIGDVMLSGITENGGENEFGMESKGEYDDDNLSEIHTYTHPHPHTHPHTYIPTHIHTCIQT